MTNQSEVISQTKLSKNKYIVFFQDLRLSDISSVGGKNASLGEMINQLSHAEVRVPLGFATTTKAFQDFVSFKNDDQISLSKKIKNRLENININDIKVLSEAGKDIRKWIIDTPFSQEFESQIRQSYEKLQQFTNENLSFAVRSSATAEDLPDASFAGQQETFLNVKGLPNILEAIKHVFASLYNDRAISYRSHKGYNNYEVSLSAGIQQMVRSDKGSSGVVFTIDTESGFSDVVFITSSYGLGETIVQGAVNPDEFYIHKGMLAIGKKAIIRKNIGSKLIKMEFSDQVRAGCSVKTVDVSLEKRNQYSLCDSDVIELAKYAITIEKHYGCPMDIEWAKDGIDGKIYILQARPETVKSQEKIGTTQKKFKLKTKSKIITSGRAIGQKIGAGCVKIIKDQNEMERVQPGDILVTDMTDPNWEPVMKIASGIVTNRGGRTCHAAIIARELGIPAIVGCNTATKFILNNLCLTHIEYRTA